MYGIGGGRGQRGQHKLDMTSAVSPTCLKKQPPYGVRNTVSEIFPPNGGGGSMGKAGGGYAEYYHLHHKLDEWFQPNMPTSLSFYGTWQKKPYFLGNEPLLK